MQQTVTTSGLSSGKIAKYEYLTGEEILLSDQSQIIKQAKFTYFSLEKTLEKETKTIQDQAEKQIKTIESRVEKQLLDTDQKSVISFFQKIFLSKEAICKLYKIKEIEEEVIDMI